MPRGISGQNVFAAIILLVLGGLWYWRLKLA
jgi:hypothetical protein